MEGAEASEAAQAAEKRIADIFQKWDLANEGRISADDLRKVLMDLGVCEDDVQVIFAAADTNSDGWIDYSEFVAWICGSDEHVKDVRGRLENPRVLAEIGVNSSEAPRNSGVDGGISDQQLAKLRAETRYLSTPTPIVRRTFEAMYLILNVGDNSSPSKAPSWKVVQRMLQDIDLGERLRSFDMDALRAAEKLTTYLIQNYFGPGGANPPARLKNGDETLTLQRVRRASMTAALLFEWSCKELIGIEALLPPPEESPEPSIEEQLRQQEEELRQLRNKEEPTLSGDLAALPSRDDMVEPHQVLFQLMTGATDEATHLAEALNRSGPCDRCDGPHHAIDCPHFGPHKGHKVWTPRSRGRVDHEDAWENFDKEETAADEENGQRELVVSGKQVRQPGDGTCLYHSMSYGLRRADLASSGFTGHDLRKEIADWCEANADETVSGTSLRDYIWWDHQLTVEAYCKKMRDGGSLVWGGAIEIASCTLIYGVNIHVYVPEVDTRAHASNTPDTERFRRIATFGNEDAKPTVAVTYMLRCHYDALVLESET